MGKDIGITEFKIKKHVIEQAVYDVFKDFLDRSNHLSDETKKKLTEEFDNYVSTDYMFDPHKIERKIKDSVHYDWQKRNLQRVSLYSRVVVNAANHSDRPHKIAKKALEDYDKTFDSRDLLDSSNEIIE